MLFIGMAMMAVSCGYAGGSEKVEIGSVSAGECDSIATAPDGTVTLGRDSVKDEDYILEDEDWVYFVLPDDLKSYDSVLESFRNPEEETMHSEGALFDITGDDVPELWVVEGTCEADKRLYVYTLKRGRPVKVFQGDASHSWFSKRDGRVYNFSTNCGGGFLALYEYKRGKVRIVKQIEFSLFNEEGEPRAVNEKEDKELQTLLYETTDTLRFYPIKKDGETSE